MVDYRAYLRESNAIENVHADRAVETSLQAWHYLAEQDELTHDVVQRAHELLLGERQPDVAGEYRDIQVYVGDDTPPEPGRVPYEMAELLERDPPGDGVEAIRWHVDFEHVHPFADGNGRIGRLLYLWHCGRLGIEPIVWRVADIEGYYALFENPDPE